MQNRNRYPRVLLALTVLLGLVSGLILPSFAGENAAAAPMRTNALDVVISEVAWAGTSASPDDEWIELYNPGVLDVVMDNWRLIAGDGNPDITITGCSPNCTIPAGGFFLLERGYDSTVKPTPANLIFLGQLSDAGETLILRDVNGVTIDTGNSDGGAWPAGNISTPASMERVIESGTVRADSIGGWITYANGINNTVTDANGLGIFGTPGQPNWAFSVTPTFTPSITPPPTNTSTPTVTNTSPPSPPMTLLINEVAWMGTLASSSDEWVELYNPGVSDINLSGWKLNASDGSPAINLTGTILAGGYFLIASSSAVFNDVTVDQTFSGSFSNEGELLRLLDPSNIVVDTANSDSGPWPAGIASPSYSTMERRGAVTDGFFSWSTFAGSAIIAHDRNNNAVKGTPGASNWGITVTLTSTATVTATRTSTLTRTPTRRLTPTNVPPVVRPIINEFLPRPGFDWNQDGKVDVFDEFIEIKNIGVIDVNLSGWKLDDEANLGSNPFTLPNIILKPGERVVYYGLQTNILLSDGGDTVRLLNPSGKIYDAYTYPIAKVEDKSICRLPDGIGSWFEDCTPTPGILNTREGVVPVMPHGDAFKSPVCDLPDTLPADFLFAECRGYGANIWRSMYWDKTGWQGDQFVPENMSKWESFVE